MQRADLEHLTRAAATIADDDELIVVGSQAVLARFPDAPEEMLRSSEADRGPVGRRAGTSKFTIFSSPNPSPIEPTIVAIARPPQEGAWLKRAHSSHSSPQQRSLWKFGNLSDV